MKNQGPDSVVIDTPIDLWRRAFAVNVEGVAVLGEMVKRKTGS